MCPHLGIHLCCHNYLNVTFKHLIFFNALRKLSDYDGSTSYMQGGSAMFLCVCLYTQVDQKFSCKTPKIILFVSWVLVKFPEIAAVFWGCISRLEMTNL